MKTTLENTKSIQENFIYDVIIAGAGPVGLFLACELALAKCSVLILEKEKDPGSPLKKLPFGMRGLSAPTIEALYRRDLLKELQLHKSIKKPHITSTTGPQLSAPQRPGGHFAGIQFNVDNVEFSQWKYRLSSATEVSLISEMEELEKMLTSRAEALGVVIRRGLGLTHFKQNGDEVTVQSVDQSFQSKWLVGCDGSRSMVRKTGGFEFAGTEPEFTGYSTHVTIADPEKLNPGRNVTATGMYLLSQPDYLVMQDFDGGEFHKSGKPVTLEHAQELLRRISDTDVTITALHIATTWTDRARQATTYRNERVFLAGDAAHIHAPLGGQGLNLGLGDAMNLGWKLAAVVKNKASEGLLDTYQAERHPIGVNVLDWSRAQVAIMKPDPAARALNSIVRELINTRDGATYFAGRIWGISTHYKRSDEHPLIGHSVPNFEFEDGTAIGGLMQDGLWILLDFGGNTLLKTLATEYGDQLKYVYRRAKQQLGLSTVLIRPDGFVAWASEQDANEELTRRAADLWFTS
ncbi:FAD-dependent monooxygenase [Pedobacter caeni]|uniref:2-polyprenyl-6-methoxyphenol hydroxylase n=1 Tax=Pedobacter caeni TaxID=288992 RepID=A0A1M4V4Q1_9SPHI|nr:FAD-dependent monooxygenase [Pedobacter caeni]SHE63872.1 2-polyprenyl-6-methoxyphenol hydroxylase [Pedobacter caeni]